VTPSAPLIQISIWSQVVNGVLLPVVLVCMILLINNRKIMGKHVNKLGTNIIGWSTIAVLVVLSLMLLVIPLFS